MILLDYIDENIVNFNEEQNITTILVENTVNEELKTIFPVADEMVSEALSYITDKTNYPLILVSKTGRNSAGVVVACLRKLMHYSFISIYEEYRRFSSPRLQLQHEQFIELYDIELVVLNNEKLPPFLLRSWQ